jgi:hypothetical protein
MKTRKEKFKIFASSLSLVGATGAFALINFLGGENDLFQTNLFQKSTTAPTINSENQITIAGDSLGNFIIAQIDSTANLTFQKFSPDKQIHQKLPSCGLEAPIRLDSNVSKNSKPNVAINSEGEFFITWQNNAKPETLQVAHLNTNCELKKQFEIENSQATHQIASSADYLYLAEQKDENLFLQIFSAKSLEELTQKIQINDPENKVINFSSIAINSFDEVLLTWEGSDKLDEEGVFGQVFNSSGIRLHLKNQLINSFTPGRQFNPKAVSLGTKSFAIAWQGLSGAARESVYLKILQSCNSNGCEISNSDLIVSLEDFNSKRNLSLLSDEYANLHLNWIDESSEETIANTQGNLLEITNGQNKIEKQSVNANTQLFVTVDMEGNKKIFSIGGETAIYEKPATFLGNPPIEFVSANQNNSQTNAHISSRNDGANTTIIFDGDGGTLQDSQGVFVSLFTPIDDIRNIPVNKFTNGAQSRGRISTFNNGEFVACFDGESAQTKQGVFVQNFESDGTPKNGSQIVYQNESTLGGQIFCDIAVDPNKIGNFAVSYDGIGPNDTQGVFLRNFENHKMTNLLEINQRKEGFQGYAKIASDQNGNKVIIWISEENSRQKIYGQQINSNGEKIGDNFAISDQSAANQSEASIAFGENNNFIVTWTEENHIYAKFFQFEPTGLPISLNEAFQISRPNSAIQSQSSSSGNNLNQFAIAWREQISNSLDSKIKFRLFEFDEIATPLTPESTAFQSSKNWEKPNINMRRTGNQFTIAAAGFYESENQSVFKKTFSNIENQYKAQLAISATQEVVNIGRTLKLPTIAKLENTKVSFEEQINQLTFANLDESEAIFEVKDFTADGNEFQITVSALDLQTASNKTEATQVNEENINTDEPQAENSIAKTNFFVRNFHDIFTENKFRTIIGENTDFQLDTSSSDFVSLKEAQILAKISGKQSGIWQFLPQIYLKIPAMTPPGEYFGGLIFSLE